MGNKFTDLIVKSDAYKKYMIQKAEEACSILEGRVADGMYPSLSGGVEFSVDYEMSGDFSFDVTLSFDESSLIRPSLNPANPGVYDIVGLITQGWRIADEVRLPIGKWHGKYRSARRWFIGSYFLEESVRAGGNAMLNIEDIVYVSKPIFLNDLYHNTKHHQIYGY